MRRPRLIYRKSPEPLINRLFLAAGAKHTGDVHRHKKAPVRPPPPASCLGVSSSVHLSSDPCIIDRNHAGIANQPEDGGSPSGEKTPTVNLDGLKTHDFRKEIRLISGDSFCQRCDEVTVDFQPVSRR